MIRPHFPRRLLSTQQATPPAIRHIGQGLARYFGTQRPRNAYATLATECCLSVAPLLRDKIDRRRQSCMENRTKRCVLRAFMSVTEIEGRNATCRAR
jgi:hypothetical protein